MYAPCRESKISEVQNALEPVGLQVTGTPGDFVFVIIVLMFSPWEEEKGKKKRGQA